MFLLWALPERQETGFEQDSTQSPLDLFIIDQLGRSQTAVVGGETKTRMQHLKHPGWLEALIPALRKAACLVKVSAHIMLYIVYIL